MVHESLKKHWSLIKQSIRIQIINRLFSYRQFTLVSFGVVVQILLSLVFFNTLFLVAEDIAGWSLAEVYVLAGTFHLVDIISWSTFGRAFFKIPRFIEEGDLDLYLTRPVNLRTFLTYCNIDPIFIYPQLITSIVIIFLGALMTTENINILLYLFMLGLSIILYYSIFVAFYSINFFAVHRHTGTVLREINYLGRMPVGIFKGAFKVLLYTLVPLAAVFTIPAKSLFYKASILEITYAIGITLFFLLFSNWFWNFSIKHYQSANG